MRTTRRTSPALSALVSAAANIRARSPIRPDTITVNSVASVMMPRPPICDSRMITSSPNSDQCRSVSTMVSPVRLTAEVAVNRAVIHPVGSPDAVAIGSESRRVPSRAAAPNPVAMTWVGFWNRSSRPAHLA